MLRNLNRNRNQVEKEGYKKTGDRYVMREMVYYYEHPDGRKVMVSKNGVRELKK